MSDKKRAIIRPVTTEKLREIEAQFRDEAEKIFNEVHMLYDFGTYSEFLVAKSFFVKGYALRKCVIIGDCEDEG